MPLEATMMIIDNSEYMRNGDYYKTRFSAQSDAVKTVFGSKIDSNPENTVGVMTSAGKGPEVLVTHTKEVGHMLQVLHDAEKKISGQADIPTALSVAQLALKHRQNKNLRQRIILFIGSPLTGEGADEKNMITLATKLRKNNIAVDVISFGDEEGREANDPILNAFVKNVIGKEPNSHFVSIAPGPDLLSDVILSSPIVSEDFPSGVPTGAGGETSATGATNNFEFGIDPSLDPELAMALRMSLEEEQARQRAAVATEGASSSSAPLEPIPESSPTTSAPATTTTSQPTVEIEDDEDAMLARALAMSKGEEGEDVDMADAGEEEMSEEEAIAKAIAMSMQEDQGEGKKDEKK
ncbi:hypothetical protein M422DRAFT_216127 [Sphaerobolus stellatus SS14]|uniref:VWFA domain-containing protein n=1 Tax=Sphaerobolus stellatus (strain SS14) TaxID=990650 RepID=A0A0C9TC83_SPHS4|nr:hypothetical protein M422DRAFT_216127 [Sphaerobolus stellatus SS14]